MLHMIALLMHDHSKGIYLMYLHQNGPRKRPLLERRPKVADVAARANRELYSDQPATGSFRVALGQ